VPTGNMAEPDLDYIATLLPSGGVLVAAGLAGKGVLDPPALGWLLHHRYQMVTGNKSLRLWHLFPIGNKGERSLALPLSRGLRFRKGYIPYPFNRHQAWSHS
jgi:hypothetical protein